MSLKDMFNEVEEQNPVEVEPIREQPQPDPALINRVVQTNRALQHSQNNLQRTTEALQRERAAVALQNQRIGRLEQRQAPRRQPLPVVRAAPTRQAPRKEPATLRPSAVIRNPTRKATSVKSMMPRAQSYMNTGLPASSLPMNKKKSRRMRS
jgi:hypothetical protein